MKITGTIKVKGRIKACLHCKTEPVQTGLMLIGRIQTGKHIELIRLEPAQSQGTFEGYLKPV